jgi:hypothetical protein
MSLCGKPFSKPERICQLDEGHEGLCAGPIRPGLFGAARRARKQAHASFEAGQRAAVSVAPRPSSGAMTPAQFAAEIVRCLGEGSRFTAAEILAWLESRWGALIVNRAPAGLRELRQTLARLQRDRMIEKIGDEFARL